MSSSKDVDILLVEDNPADIDLTRESLAEARILCDLDVVMDGKEAMDYLYQRAPHERAPRPDLVLLDLNLPGMSGQQILKEIKEDKKLRQIPVVILTSSQAETDIAKAYEFHANSYVVKPVELDEFIDIMEQIGTFWLRVVQLPNS